MEDYFDQLACKIFSLSLIIRSFMKTYLTLIVIMGDRMNVSIFFWRGGEIFYILIDKNICE